MARVFRLIFFFVLGSLAVFFPLAPARSASPPPQGVYPDQGTAFANCVAMAAYLGSAWSCSYRDPSPGVYTTNVSASLCSSLKASSAQYAAMNGTTVGPAYNWCVPADCSQYDSGYPDANWSGAYGDGTVYCSGGCMGVFHGYPGLYQLCLGDGACTSQGHFSGNGNRCSSSIDASLFSAKPPDMTCSHNGLSCYNKDKGFCATTESGEQVCEPAPPPGSGGCSAGATGSTCVGNNTAPPPPSDPPIPKGQAPDNTQTATGKDSGGTTNNYTQNNYSGTSPGGSDTSSGSDSGTGSQSNQNGSGNSPGPGGDHGTGSDGKCPDGSVPTASGCSGTASDTGCDTPPQCFGDAVLCASFKEQVAIRCNTRPASSSSSGGIGNVADALAGAGVPADGGASSDPSASGLVSSSDLGEDGFDASGLGFSRACPANPTFNVLGHSYTLDLTPFCNFAGMLGWFVLLVSMLVALRIVATGKA
jgi:hypothetical protein